LTPAPSIPCQHRLQRRGWLLPECQRLGQSFANVLGGAGSSSPTGILALAASSNSSTESTLNAEITKEQTYISTQQANLTKELNQANQI